MEVNERNGAEMQEMFSNSSDFDASGGGNKEPEYDIFAGWDDGDESGVTEEDTETVEPPETSGEEAQQQEEAPTTEQPNAEEAPTTEQKKLRFKAKIDHQEQDVDILENDLPALYQKAQNEERAVRRADEAKATADGYKVYMDKMAQIASLMNFDGKTTEEQLDAFYEGMVGTAKENRVKELVEAGTAQAVAEFVVEQQMKDAAQGMAKAEVQDNPGAGSEPGNTEPQRQPPSPEQFQKDLHALFVKFPEAGKTEEFPHEVMDAYIRGEDLTVAYMEYKVKHSAAENRKLKEQNSILQQNQASARKAPIKNGVSGGAGKQKAEDPLLAGFDYNTW